MKTPCPRPATEDDISLWNDPRWKRAAESMGGSQLETYKSIGEGFNSIDYPSGQSAPVPIPEPAVDCIAYIEAGLRSGLSIEDLSEEEVNLLQELLGNDWKAKALKSVETDVNEKVGSSN